MIASRFPGITALVVIFLNVPAQGQKKTYWQQEVKYNIKVELQPDAHMLKGDLQLDYINHSPETLKFIWFHLWPNAYKDKNTALFKQLQKVEERREKLDKVKEMGSIDQLDWKVNNRPAVTEPHPDYIDVIKLILPQPLAPGATVMISTPFRVKIPDYFSRLGFKNNEFMITQWYPKPAVFDADGWHPIPYLDMGEFYSEYGSFKVDITVPSAYVVAATGKPLNTDEFTLYKQIGAKNVAALADAYRQKDTADHEKLISHLQFYQSPGKADMKTVSYTAENLHDFAWFAEPDFIINYDSLKMASGKMIDVFTFYHKESIGKWLRSTQYAKSTVLFYNDAVGEYPYPIVNVVEGPENTGSGGMEYPMVTLITQPDADDEALDATIAHEIGHNWFYGILGSNERSHAWMDEGINTFFQFRYEAMKYRANSLLGPTPETISSLPADEFEDIVYKTLVQVKVEDAIDKDASEFTSDATYALCVYLKTAMWLHLLEKEISKETLQKGIKLYFERWQFKHPSPDDFRDIMEEVSGKDLKKIFKLLAEKKSFSPDMF